MKRNQNTESTTNSIVPFDRAYLADYVSLNREWIQTHFAIEPMDIAQLETPDELILSIGGEIFFLLEHDRGTNRVIGTCAMVPHGPRSFELAKMAVTPSARGQGHGDTLMAHVIQWAKDQQAHKVILLSNTILAPAISLYHKHGFKTVHLGPHPDYQRCNIEMELELAMRV